MFPPLYTSLLLELIIIIIKIMKTYEAQESVKKPLTALKKRRKNKEAEKNNYTEQNKLP